ncbi:deoxyribodipyrimidine photolyase [Flavobacterium magnum]|uniref:Deoxyribodipyrimidine photolyase n=1 Tax=Flavobacterium magnum TaxID=2162713 RepID=A0A2S0RCL3_9FLAO|nr:FAD-binding domain-containing protein [Flavobacterium magnum]AWA29426.1 deoxyribodipyrimidine photolyase [Flavobacterium magnum]
MNSFPTAIDEILACVENFDPTHYAATRNFKDGQVSRLSPYISRGVITTRQVFRNLKARYPKTVLEKFIRELLWRDYFQRLLQSRPELYHASIRTDSDAKISGIPIAILNGVTGIREIDAAVHDLYQTGYMHNHFRLYVASICCNVARLGFSVPAGWMYYHLLDADVASNFASWQWVAGNLTGKKYIANQENINFYSRSQQSATFLDCTYDELQDMPVPEILKDHTVPVLDTFLTKTGIPDLKTATALLYDFYNLNPFWHEHEHYDRILILEPSHFRKFPVSEKVMAFVLALSRNIPNLKVYCGEFEDLRSAYPEVRFIAREHPIINYHGAQVESREWIVPEVTGFYPSYSKYYTACLKYLNYE